MSDQRASVVVNAPVEQVYALFSHFNDFPKFMRFVKEVTYDDDTHSHWVVDIAGRQEWEAENTGWVPNRQIGWVSIAGLQNAGLVTFTPSGTSQTRVDVAITYDPPGGPLGHAGDALGAGNSFSSACRRTSITLLGWSSRFPRDSRSHGVDLHRRRASSPFPDSAENR